MGYFDFSTYGLLDWILFVSGILFTITAIYMWDVYRLTKEKSYLYLWGFIILATINSFVNVKFDFDSNLSFVITQYSNRFAWFFTYLLGFSLLDNTEKRLSDRTKRLFYSFTIISSIELVITANILSETANTQSTIAILSQHLHQILGIATFTYCIYVMGEPVDNKSARRSKAGWLFFGASWTVFYIIQLLTIIISGFSASDFNIQEEFPLLELFILIIWIAASLIFIYIVIFIPENLLITKDHLIVADKLYKLKEKSDSVGYSLTYASLIEYIESLPAEYLSQPAD